jgi:nuclear control of ATPase protein 2
LQSKFTCRILLTVTNAHVSQVRRVDAQLDRLQLNLVSSSASSPVLTAREESLATAERRNISTSPRITELQSIVKALSTTSSSNPLLSTWRISKLLDQAALSVQERDIKSAYETELEWLLISKATVQTYGAILNTLLDQIIPLSNDIWYWDEVLGSYTYTGLYAIQTSPMRFWAWVKDIYEDMRRRLVHLPEAPDNALSAQRISASLTTRWRQFYVLVQESISYRSTTDIQRRVLSPIALYRNEARQKQAAVKRLQELSASGLGVLMDEGLSFDVDDDGNSHGKPRVVDRHEWKDVVERSVALMDIVLQNMTALETGVSDFEDAVFASVEQDPEISQDLGPTEASRPAKLSRRLKSILEVHIPNHIASSRRLASEYGRPSKLIRYWLPISLLLLSSTTILRVFFNRRAAVITWIRDLGSTTRDFWFNWVVDPIKRVIGTIRHDEGSEVAIMSKESLKGDRESLERMVVDFIIDNPEAANASTERLTEPQIAGIRARVKEGDLTPVLRVYEEDLRRPIIGAIKGDLIRTLLIQIQKTKVDVEVALNGIDAILKSQELVFGFIGLTPGILVCISAISYVRSIFGDRRGLKRGIKAGQAIRVLRNIDRILILSTPSPNGMLSYKDHGLLLCEAHILRSCSKKLFPGDIEREFLEDVDELGNISIGIERQLKALERIRWVYAKWLSK